MRYTDSERRYRSMRPVSKQPALCLTASGHRVVRIARHAVERYCERRQVTPPGAWRRILLLAANGQAVGTPSGPALRVGTDYLGFEPTDGQPDAVVIVTYYILTIPSARRQLNRLTRPSGLGTKPGRHPFCNRHSRKRRSADKHARGKRDNLEGPSRGKPYVRRRREFLADFEEEWR
jgi:hypothetical protein